MNKKVVIGGMVAVAGISIASMSYMGLTNAMGRDDSMTTKKGTMTQGMSQGGEYGMMKGMMDGDIEDGDMEDGDMKNRGMMNKSRMGTGAELALKNNDYTGFVAALAASDKGAKKADKLTPEMFARMVAQYTKRQAIEAAITANDYNAFVKASTPTAAEFADIVKQRATHTAVQKAIEAKDYTAFLAAIKGTPMEGKVTQAQFTTMTEKGAAHIGKKGKRGQR